MPNNEIGSVYVLKNKMFPGLLKIGRTTQTVEVRNSNFDTGLPESWEVVCAVKLEEYKKLETALKHLFVHRRYRDDREFFFFPCEYEEDIKLLFELLSNSQEYNASNATDEVTVEIVDAENEINSRNEGIYKLLVDGAEYSLYNNDDVFLKAKFNKSDFSFIFDRDLEVKEPNFTDNYGAALKSAKSLYSQFCVNGDIDENGIFKLKDKRIPLKQMNRYTVVALNKSANWYEQWKDKDNKTLKKILNS